MKIKIAKRYRVFEAASLEDAHRLGYFVGSLTRYELMERITKHNPQLRWYANARGMGLWDTNKSKAFICGITRATTIPRYSIIKHDKKKDRVMNYSTPDGEISHTEVMNIDEDDGQMLARGWEATFKVIKGHGYAIDESGLY
jgi:hypothetical protein